MRPHRAHVPELSQHLSIRGREARHLLEVLRAKPGDTLTLFDGSGKEAKGKIVTIEEGVVTVEAEAIAEASREVGVAVELYLPLLKGDKMADVVRAATELGATRIIPTVTLHCVVKELGEGKLERLGRIAIEAAKQSERTVVPSIAQPIKLKDIPQMEQGFVAHPGSGVRVREVLKPDRAAALITGPEGGLSENEVEMLMAKGFTPVTLGQRILRAETAPVALLSLLTAGEGV
jgi:16S rRNA (uracil1498-N3)-methyltransferase